MRRILWKLKSRGFQLISLFISRENGLIDKVFASVMKDGKGYTYDGKEFIENPGIEGKEVEIDKIDTNKIDKMSPEERHMVLISSEGVRILKPEGIGKIKVVELTLDGKLVAEYERQL